MKVIKLLIILTFIVCSYSLRNSKKRRTIEEKLKVLRELKLIKSNGFYDKTFCDNFAHGIKLVKELSKLKLSDAQTSELKDIQLRFQDSIDNHMCNF